MKLSIIIPVYNEQGTLYDVVKNVRSVKFPVDYEIIVVDDGSSCGKREEDPLDRLRGDDGRIKIFKNIEVKTEHYSLNNNLVI